MSIADVVDKGNEKINQWAKSVVVQYTYDSTCGNKILLV